MTNKSIDEIAEELCHGGVVNANGKSYDVEDVKALMDLKGLDVYDSAYELAEEIKGEE